MTDTLKCHKLKKPETVFDLKFMLVIGAKLKSRKNSKTTKA